MPLEPEGSSRRVSPRFPIVVIGTRAQLIKMAPVLRELQSRRINYRLIFTGQHLVTMRDLLNDFLVEAEPVWLGRPREIDTLAGMASWFPHALWQLAVSSRKLLIGPDGTKGLVVVHGDTISTLLGALAGRLNRCQVAHVESGLRSFSIRDPFPEELTRLMVFRLVEVAFCPGRWATENMAPYRATSVDTGANTLLDAVRYATDGTGDNMGRAGERDYCVVSIHRHENLASYRRMRWILETVRDIARTYRVEFVLHPTTLSRLTRSGQLALLKDDAAVQLQSRMGYLSFMRLLAGASFVLTDGGSNQEELSYLGIPTLIARERSERLEGLGRNAELLPYREGLAWQAHLDAIRKRMKEDSDLSSHAYPSRHIVDWITGNKTGISRA